MCYYVLLFPIFHFKRFRATLYPCPETPQERRDMSIGVMTRIDDLTTVSLYLLNYLNYLNYSIYNSIIFHSSIIFNLYIYKFLPILPFNRFNNLCSLINNQTCLYPLLPHHNSTYLIFIPHYHTFIQYNNTLAP